MAIEMPPWMESKKGQSWEEAQSKARIKTDAEQQTVILSLKVSYVK